MKNDPIAYERFWSTIRSEGGGWAKPPRSRRWHFFRGESLHEARLCHDSHQSEPGQKLHQDAPSAADRCSICVHKLAGEFLRWHPEAPIFLLTLRRLGPCPCCGVPVEWWTRPPGLVWLPPIEPKPGETPLKGDQVYLERAEMRSLKFHEAACPDGYLYRVRNPWSAHAEDEALEQYQRRLDAKGE